jgi:3-methylcrotonyl-CoA carboxylase alpha subunit
MFKRLLIANRGEIACRIIKTAKRLNITTIAIYSDVDVNALYVEQADEALHIGPAPAVESYLNIDKIIQAAKVAKADAIHPGYGFLAENAHFAKACEDNHIIFVGPSSTHMRIMGLKDESKKLAGQYGCPVVPQFDDLNHLQFPLLIKPIAGGGGKGMQIVENQTDFEEKLAAAKRQALNSFGNDQVLLEKYLQNPRHIEIQVLGDKHGHAIYLFERDCSLQRRYQKIIEQAPAPQISQSLREKIGNAALKIVQGLGYVGAGTVEFLLDKNDEFYFMEMNTRLQVEHGVTELITGIDLVEWQLRIASGEHLSLQQTDLKINGVAIEARLYAEDPFDDFLPSTGTIAYLAWPENARIDNGIRVGDKITIYYDPLLAKILVHADTHQAAWEKLAEILQQVRIAGVKTNLDFLRQLSQNPTITQNPVDTHFIDTHPELCSAQDLTQIDCLLLSIAIILKQNTKIHSISPWKKNYPWRLNTIATQKIIFYHAQKPYEFLIEYLKSGYKINNALIPFAQLDNENLTAQINDEEYHRTVIFQENRIYLLSKDHDLLFTLPIRNQASQTKTENTLRAPMPGKIVQILIKENDTVAPDQALVVLEAMKMEHTLRASQAGIIKTIHFQVGDQLNEGDVVVELKC